MPKSRRRCGSNFYKELYLITHSDPITEALYDPGFLSITVACNDINMKGSHCRWVITTILLQSLKDLDKIVAGEKEACKIINCKIVGGHTEVTPGISSSSIVITTAFSISNNYLDIKNVKEGDYIVQVFSIGIEGTWILATEFKGLLKSKGISENLLQK